jgi:hypothetical protein
MSKLVFLIACLAPMLALADEADQDVAFHKGRDLYIQGKYAAAREQFKKAGDDAPTWAYIGASSCRLIDRPAAAAAWNKIDKDDRVNRHFMAIECAKAGNHDYPDPNAPPAKKPS